MGQWLVVKREVSDSSRLVGRNTNRLGKETAWKDVLEENKEVVEEMCTCKL